MKKDCSKWKHDFSYEGKLRQQDIKCKRCNINLIQWVKDREVEFQNKDPEYWKEDINK